MAVLFSTRSLSQVVCFGLNFSFFFIGFKVARETSPPVHNLLFLFFMTVCVCVSGDYTIHLTRQDELKHMMTIDGIGNG